MENNKSDEPILKSIKVGRVEYDIKKGDYIMFNGACYQLISGDGRILYSRGFDSYDNIRLPNIAIKKIPFNQMLKKNKINYGRKIIYWFF